MFPREYDSDAVTATQQISYRFWALVRLNV